jgi:hypothetical protein
MPAIKDGQKCTTETRDDKAKKNKFKEDFAHHILPI